MKVTVAGLIHSRAWIPFLSFNDLTMMMIIMMIIMMMMIMMIMMLIMIVNKKTSFNKDSRLASPLPSLPVPDHQLSMQFNAM